MATDWTFVPLYLDIVLLPEEFVLSPAYPNPFNPTTTINFALPTDAKISIVVYNLQGSEVSTLINEYYNAGYYSINWDASNHASGIYFVKMISDNYSDTQKLMLVK